MPKLPRIPRVSIVIPLQRDEQQFEETLLSVLENQPEECQIIAAHNGTYTDPFELADEITFVTARSSNLVDLVRDAFDATTGSIVHVLGTGMKAHAGWLDEAIKSFDDDSTIAALTPNLVDDSGKPINGSGWSDVAGRLCQPRKAHSRSGRQSAPRNGAANNGFFLNAFFIRRRLLADLLDAVAPAMNDPIAVSYAFGCLLKRGGWKIASTGECEIVAGDAAELYDESDGDRGQCLAAIRARTLPAAASPRWTDMLREAILGDSSIGEMIGMTRHRRNIAAMRRAIDPESVSTVEELAQIISLETNHSPGRAAA